MSLKINRQVDLESLFNKFAIDPIEPAKKKENESDNTEQKPTSPKNKNSK